MDNMGLIELTSESFKKMKGNRGHVLGIPNAQNLTLVMFHSPQCEYCDQAMPELAKLYRYLRENNLPINVAICDVSKNKKVIQEAADTVDPIKYVPYMIIYLRERPHLRYNGKKIAEEMLNYLIEVMKRIDTRQQFVAPARVQQQEDQEEQQEASPTGIPYNVVCEGDVCYLTQTEIYGGKQQKKVCVGNICYMNQEEIFSGNNNDR
jgi:hypothetical protein